jgi:protein arginine N-methyltransferase 1
MGTMLLDADLVLEVAQGLILRTRDHAVEVVVGAVRTSFDLSSLSLLGAFARPRKVSEALSLLHPGLTNQPARLEAEHSIHDLIKLGALVPHAPASPQLGTLETDFAGATQHTLMLSDVHRTETYLRAVRAAVQPDDVVLDIGTGTGILAIAAAQAGARKVYAVEGLGIADAAEAMIAQNGLSEKITLIRGWSTKIELPERATLLVSEIIGSEPFAEQMLETTADAVARLLVPGARFLPSHLAIDCTLLRLPEEELEQRCFTAENAEFWSRLYGIDFSALPAVRAASLEKFWVHPDDAQVWPALAPTCELCSLDVACVNTLGVEVSTDVVCDTEGAFDGVLITFRARLTEQETISTTPGDATTDTSWRAPVYRLPVPVQVRPGTVVRVTYRYRSVGDPLSVEVISP